jgi:hypothetical protein
MLLSNDVAVVVMIVFLRKIQRRERRICDLKGVSVMVQGIASIVK